MKIWIINPYGNIPGEGWKLHRSYMIADAFSKNGHEVTYWVSNIDHRSKKIRSENFSDIKINENLEIRIVPTTKYSDHISYKRVRAEVNFIKNLRNYVYEKRLTTDLIIVGEPALFISMTVVKLVNKLKAKLLIDFIDIWPELFAIALPKFLLPLNKIILAPLYWKRRWFVKKADVLLSVSEAYLAIGKRYNSKVPSKVIYWGVDLKGFDRPENINVLERLKLPLKSEKELWVIYAGTLGDNYDLRTIVELARIIDKSPLAIKLIIAGDGNLKEFVSNSISELTANKSYFLGRTESEDLNDLYKFCDVSLSTYVPGSSVSMPIKAFDYFAAGLPLINSLGMDLQHFVESQKVGLQYKAGDANDIFEKAMIFYQNIDLLIKMKQNCKKLAKDFDQKKLYQDYVDFVIDMNMKK
jgi:glycosyltransferase involved in cell wall biosynthesis